MKITLKEYLEYQPNGDRATSLTPSSRFEVWMAVNGKDVKLRTFDQFDGRGLFGPSVGSYANTCKKAKKYADQFGCEVTHTIFKEKPVKREKAWVEV